MVKTRIKELAQKRGIENAYQLQKKGFPPSMAARLFADDVEMIGLGTIDKLCEILKCKPGNIFIHEPNGQEKTE